MRPARAGRGAALAALALAGVLLLRGPAPGARRAELEDVFSAPLDALAGYVQRLAGRPDVAMRPTAPAPGATLGVATAGGSPMAITVDSLPDARGRVQVHGRRGAQLYAGRVLMRPAGDGGGDGGPGRPALASYYHEQANAGNPQGPSTRGWGLPGMGGWGQTGNWGDSGRLRAEHGNFDGHRSAVRLPVGVHPYAQHHGEPWSGVRRGRTNDFQVISTGPRTPEGFRTHVGTQYSQSEIAPLPVAPPPSGWYPYTVPTGKGAETHFASIRVDQYACGGPGQPPCEGKAHLKLDVFCPPYVAPAHGSVWYKGKEHFEATSTAPASRQKIRLPVGGSCPEGSGDCDKGGGAGEGGEGVPLAVVGVDIPEGESVQVSCNEHYRLTEAGSEFPRCLKSGQFERGKQCEPIMCSAYTPPENGGVWPDTPVQAGTRVTIYCFEGYEEDYDDYWPFQRNLPRAGFDSSGTRMDRGTSASLKGAARVRAAITRLHRVARRGRGSQGVGRVRHPDIAALLRAKAAARVRRRKEDRARLPPAGLPVIPMDDVMAGSQKTLDAMVRSFVATGDAGFQPGWSDKRLTYDQARAKEPVRTSSSPSSSSSYALETLTGGGGGGGGVAAALRKQNLAAEAQGLNDKYGYAVQAALNPHEDDDYKYALLDAAEGADDKILAAMNAPPPAALEAPPPAAASGGRRRLLAVAEEQLARKDAPRDGGSSGAPPRNPPVYRSQENRDKWRRMFGGEGGEDARAATRGTDRGGSGGGGGSGRRNPMYRSPWQEKPKKHPMCQDWTGFERGITCRPLPSRIGHELTPPTPAPPPPGEFHQAPTTVSVPEQYRDFPPVAHCRPYVPPQHGSAWYKGREYRVATPAVQEREIVTLTCDENYRLSDRGSRWPECLHDGHWDKGKTCEALMCPPYKPPAHGSVDICEAVQAGTRVTISCDTSFMTYGQDTGGHRSPRCLADGTYEKGVECVPRPCPKGNKIPLPPDEPCVSEDKALLEHPISVPISHKQIHDWEQGLQRQDVYDYTPNVFDHEPRPYQIPQGMDDWRVHEGSTHVGGSNDGDGVLIKHDVGARWPTHQTGEPDSPADAKWKGPWGFDGEPHGKDGVTPPLADIGV